MSNATRRIAEFGNDKGNARNVRVVVEIGDGAKLSNKPRTINYTVDGTAIRGDDADNPEDYFIDGCTSSNCSVRLPANTHSAVITINVNDDGLDEDDETIVLTLKDDLKDNSNKNGYTLNAQKTTTVTIRDDDTRGLTFYRRWPDVDEGSSETHTLRLRSQPTAAVTVKIASDNPDVTVSPSSLTFNPSGNNLWDRNQTVTISAAQDRDAVDDTATLTYTTSGGDYGGAKALSIDRPVSVDDDDTGTTTGPQLPTISLTGGAAVTEGGAASFTVNADPAPTSSLTINVEVIEPPGQDFVAASEEGVKTVTLNAGATSTTFTVPTVNDGTSEEDGRVQVFVNDGTGYVASQGAGVTVRDNDDPIPAAYFRSASSSAAENAGTRNVTVNLSPAAPSGGLTLSYSVTGTATAGNGNDFTIQNSGTLSVAAGATTASIPVAINDDSIAESAETVILTLAGGTGYTLGSPGAHTLTITDNDGTGQPAVSFASTSSSAAESAGTRNVRVNLSAAAPSGGLTLRYSVTGTATAGSGNDFTIAGSGSLSVAARATFATIPVAINDDSSTESAETVILTLTGGTGYTLGSTTVYTLTITDNDDVPPPPRPPPGTPGLMISKNTLSVSEGGTGSYTVQLATAPTGMVTVAIASTNADVTVSPAPLTFHASGSSKRWDTAQTVTVSARQDSDAVDDTATLTHTTGGVKAASVTVAVDDDETLGGARTAATVAKDNPPRADPAAWLARFGRMVAGQALGGITGRMAAARRAGFAGSIGRRAIGFGSQTPGSQARPGPGLTTGAGGTGAAPESADVFEGGGPVNAARLSPGSLSGAGLSLSDIDRMFGTGRAAGASRTLTGRDLMLGSRFTLTGERDATGGSLAFWGQAAQSGFDGREGRVSLDGKAVTAMLGADYARDRWLAGMALMQSGGKGDSRATAAGAGSGSGDVETTLTAALPYASLQVSERMKLWGALGHGTGEVTLKPEPGRTLKSDISWTMAATGLRSEVIPPPEEGSGPALALVSDALWAGTSSDKAHELAASDSDVTRLRLGLEGSWTMALQDGGLVTPKLEAGLRHDDGDAETGFGVELGGGLAWEDPRLGLSLDLSGRMLVTHGADDLKDRGFAASLAFDPDPSTERGLSLALRQERGGASSGGLDALFQTEPLSERTGSESDTRWSAEAAWGFPALGRRFTGSPHVGLGIATGARDYTLGWRLTPEAGAPDLGFGVTATRRESDEAAPQHGIGVELNTRW